MEPTEGREHMETINPATLTKVSRDVLVAQLRARDGDMCQYPDCNESLDFTITEGRLEVTLDHWIPQYFGKANGWTNAEIWDVSNLKLMHKKCNAAKGDRVPNEDGTLPPKPMSSFRFRRQKRANRPDEPCNACDNGHNLNVGEVCAQCGCNAQRFPRHAKVKASECDHEIFWCWACSIGITPRPAAVDTAVLQAESGEWD